MAPDQRLADEIVGEFGDGHDVADIARRRNLTTGQVYEILHHAVGPEPQPPIDIGHGPGQLISATPVAIVRVPPTSTLAVVSLVLGVIAMLGGFVLLALPGIIAVICGMRGLRETRDGTRSGRAMAVAGVLLGYLSLIPMVIVLVLLMTGMLFTAVHGPAPE